MENRRCGRANLAQKDNLSQSQLLRTHTHTHMHSDMANASQAAGKQAKGTFGSSSRCWTWACTMMQQT